MFVAIFIKFFNWNHKHCSNVKRKQKMKSILEWNSLNSILAIRIFRRKANYYEIKITTEDLNGSLFVECCCYTGGQKQLDRCGSNVPVHHLCYDTILFKLKAYARFYWVIPTFLHAETNSFWNRFKCTHIFLCCTLFKKKIVLCSLIQNANKIPIGLAQSQLHCSIRKSTKFAKRCILQSFCLFYILDRVNLFC